MKLPRQLQVFVVALESREQKVLTLLCRTMFRAAFTCKFFPSNWTQNASNSGLKQISTAAFPLQFKVSPFLWAEPLKKKKRLDPALEKQRLEKKKKRIMKEIRRLQKLEKTLKPVAELETPDCLISDLERRIREFNVPEEIEEERIRLFKEWSRYKRKENISCFKLLQRLTKSQQMALDELRLESEELYQAAVQIDPKLIPLKYSGPTETPAKEDYPVPDGAYVDVSRKWI